MPQFNLEEYDLVEDRIRAFYEDYPDGRIVTHEITSLEDREQHYFVVRAEVFQDHEDQHARCPKATGLAFEIEGGAGANKTAALENAETSAIGRALANANYASRKRPSRTEMEKAARGPQVKDPKPVPDDMKDKLAAADSEDALRELWQEAVIGGYSDTVQPLFTARKKELTNV